jgi:hypothetical protein
MKLIQILSTNLTEMHIFLTVYIMQLNKVCRGCLPLPISARVAYPPPTPPLQILSPTAPSPEALPPAPAIPHDPPLFVTRACRTRISSHRAPCRARGHY